MKKSRCIIFVQRDFWAVPNPVGKQAEESISPQTIKKHPVRRTG